MSKLASVTSGRIIRPPRIILLGVEKIGKSTFAAGADNPIFIPINLEDGIDDLDVAKFPSCTTFDDVKGCFTALDEEDHPYKTVVIDSASALEPLIWQDVCTEAEVPSIENVGGGYGKGYTEALSRWRTVMNMCDYLRETKGMASVIIGHTKIKRFDDPERESYDQYQFDVHDKASSAMYRWADLIGFANLSISTKKEDAGFNKTKVKAYDDGVGERYLYTKRAPAHPGGGRSVYGRIPAEIPLDWSEFKSAVEEVITDEAKTKNKK